MIFFLVVVVVVIVVIGCLETPYEPERAMLGLQEAAEEARRPSWDTGGKGILSAPILTASSFAPVVEVVAGAVACEVTFEVDGIMT